ncbi:MAG TPA: MFS transporter [Ktedonobacteraceae bacterium]|nr:MFS transporter [Ktedonobacteraceae bacterium]
MLLHKSKLSAYTVYLIFAALFNLSFSTIVTVNLVYQVEVAKLNPLQLVLVGTTLEVVAFLFQVPTGVLADVYSRRLAVIVGITIFGLGFIIEGSFPRFEVIVAAQVLFGIGITLVDGAEQAWIAGEVEEERIGHVFMRSTQVGLLGTLVGAGVSVALASIRLNLPLVIGGGMGLLIAVFLLLFMPESRFRTAFEQERPTWRDMGTTFLNGVRLVRSSGLLVTILLIALLYGLYSEGVDRLSTPHLLNDFMLPALGQFKPVVWFGIISALSTLLTMIASEAVRRRIDTNRQSSLIRIQLLVNVVGIASLLLFALAGNFFLALVALLTFKVYRSVNEPLYTTWLTQNSDAKVRATVISMRGQVDAIGQIAGGPPVGYVGTVISLRAALVTSSLMLSPVLLLFAYAARKVRKRVEAVDSVEEKDIRNLSMTQGKTVMRMTPEEFHIDQGGVH